MHIIARRVLYLSAFIVFFLIAPVLILYTTGVRFNIEERSIGNVGALYIKSYKPEAEIFLNGISTGKKTPTRLLNVTPGTHVITLKNGSLEPWEKKLEVISRETTFIRDAILFYKNPPVYDSKPGGGTPLVSLSKKFYVYLTADKTIALTNTENGNTYFLADQVPVNRLLALSPHLDLVLFEGNRLLHTIDLNTEKITSVAFPSSVLVKKALWDPAVPSRAWILGGGILYAHNVYPEATSRRIQGIADFLVTRDSLITLSQTPGNAIISIYPKEAGEALITATIPSQDDVELFPLVGSPEQIIIKGQAHVWIWEPSHSSEPLIFDAQYLEQRGTQLLMGNDFEVFIYNLDTKKIEMIDRTAEPVRAIHWHPSGSYIVRALTEQYELLELDARDKRNRIPIFKSSESVFVTFDQKGEKLFTVSPSTQEVYLLQ